MKPIEKPAPEPSFVVNVAPEPEKVEEEKPSAAQSADASLKDKLKTWLMKIVEDEAF